VRIDYFGMGIFVASTTLMLCGLTTSGTTHPWKSASVLSPLILGLTGLGVFVLVEWKVAKAPMVPFEFSQIEPPMQGISAHSYTALTLFFEPTLNRNVSTARIAPKDPPSDLLCFKFSVRVPTQLKLLSLRDKEKGASMCQILFRKVRLKS